MPIYRKADPSVENLLDKVIGEHHPHLAESGLTVDLLMAYGTTRSPLHPVKHHGRPAIAVVRVMSPKDRAKGLSDCEITIDGEWWKKATIEQKKAVLDHELTHLQTDGEDDDGRLRLCLRHHDIEFGWFTEVAQRHGVHAVEYQQFSMVAFTVKQQWLPFMRDARPTVQQCLDDLDAAIETVTKPAPKAKPKAKRKKKGGDE